MWLLFNVQNVRMSIWAVIKPDVNLFFHVVRYRSEQFEYLTKTLNPYFSIFWTGASDGIFERNFRGWIFGEGFFGLDFRAGEWPIDHVRIKTVFKMLTKVSSSRKTFKNRMSIEKTFIIFFQWKIRNIWNKNICVYFSCICLEKFYYKSQEIKIE